MEEIWAIWVNKRNTTIKNAIFHQRNTNSSNEFNIKFNLLLFYKFKKLLFRYHDIINRNYNIE